MVHTPLLFSLFLMILAMSQTLSSYITISCSSSIWCKPYGPVTMSVSPSSDSVLSIFQARDLGVSKHSSIFRSLLNVEMKDISYHRYCVKSTFFGVAWMVLTIIRNHVSTPEGTGLEVVSGRVPDTFVPKKPLCWTQVLFQNIRGKFGKCLHSSFRSETSSRKFCMLEKLHMVSIDVNACPSRLGLSHYTS